MRNPNRLMLVGILAAVLSVQGCGEDGGTPPGTFGLLSPTDGSAWSLPTPTFDWQNASGASTYILEVADNPGFLSPVIFETGLTSSSYTVVTPLAENTLYYWRVTAVNALGESTSTTSSCTTIAASKILADDGAANDHFGFSVSVSGDTAVIGAYTDDDNGSDSGSAYVFIRSGSTWIKQQKLIAPDGTTDDMFGSSVSLSGDTAIIGAHYDDAEGPFSGSAYVFTRSGATWTHQQKLTASDGTTNDRFGGAVAVSGDTAVVAAKYDDDKGFNSGSVYVFVRSGSTWTEQQKLSASDGAMDDYFGNSVSVSGDTVVVGSIYDDDKGIDSGSAYVFFRSGTTWTQQQKLLAADGAYMDRFGAMVSVSGDTVFAGAWNNDDRGSDSGSAYAFVRSGTTWTQQQKLLAIDGAANDYFGSDVSVSVDAAVIGAYGNDDNGAAYIFTRSTGVWQQQDKLTASDGGANDRFGSCVSISGNTVVIGAWFDDDNGNDSGSAFVFE